MTTTFIPCIQQRFFNYSKLLSELQNFLVYFFCIKNGSHPDINSLLIHIYNIIVPNSFCHITLNFNRSFHRNSGLVIVIIIQLFLILKTHAVCVPAAKNVPTSAITSPSTMCMSQPSLRNIHSNLLLFHGHGQVPLHIFQDGMQNKQFTICLQDCFCQQMHCLLKHKMLQFVLKISLYMAPTCFGP